MAASLTSCATVPNIEICGKIPRAGGAACRYTVSGEKRIITEAEWSKWMNGYFVTEGETTVYKHHGMFCVDAKGMGEQAKFIKKICKENDDRCKYSNKVASHIDEILKDVGVTPAQD